MTDERSRSLELFVKRLGYLIDITRIVDRNDDDGQFARQGREIVYVFDTNIIQMFLQPYRNPHFAALFHTDLLGGFSLRDREINEQSCLLTAEYLMSGGLPGQNERRWYMTRLHHEETRLQLDYLLAFIKETAVRIRKDPTFGNFAAQQREELNSVLRLDLDSDRNRIIELAARLGASEQSLAELCRLPSEQFRDRAAGIRSRAACRVLARDRILEPADQYHRFYSQLAPTLDTLESTLDISDRDWDEINRQADSWRSELARVLLSRGHGKRSKDSMAADCQALALVEWASSRPAIDPRRFVFVTGDRALLEAYKRRDVARAENRPFLLRPVNHFAPMFNPYSAKSSLPQRERAFRRLRQALEGALLALNLILLSEKETSDGRLRARDHFALNAEQGIEYLSHILISYFPAFRDEEWIASQQRGLDALVAGLRPIEELMLEAYPQFVAARLDKERASFEEEHKDRGVGEALAARIERRLTEAARVSFQFSQPMMEFAIQDLLKEISLREGQDRERAVIATRLSFSEDPTVYIDYSVELEQLRTATPAELRARVRALSTKVFTIATLLSLKLELWSAAARYAGLAASAAQYKMRSTQDEGAVWEDRFEHLYIEATALRFRLASTPPEAGRAYGDPWGEWLKSADEKLDLCLKHHTQAGQLSRQIRAMSERASLHVSYCEWFAFGGLAQIASHARPDQRSLRSFRIVVQNLSECDKLTAAAEARAQNDEISRAILSQVTKQFRFNIFAARLVARRLPQLWPALREPVEEAARELPEPREVPWENLPHIAEAYIAAEKGDLAALAAIDESSPSLALDAAIIGGLKAMLGVPASA